MCKICLQSDEQELNYSKTKLPSNLDRECKIFREMDPLSLVTELFKWLTQYTRSNTEDIDKSHESTKNGYVTSHLEK